MKLQGITIDFDDKRTCGLLPDLCQDWDFRYEELEDNQALVKYWEDNVSKVLEQTKDIVCGNIGTKSILYSANKKAINIIQEVFKEFTLNSINYDEIIKCERCLVYDYLDKEFEKSK